MSFLLFLCVIMSVLRPSVVMAEMYGRADMSYQQTSTTSAGKTTETSSQNQIYSVGINHSLTSTIHLTADVRYLIAETDTSRKEDVFPSLYLNFNPPSEYYVTFSYNRTETQPPGGDLISTANMNVAFALPLEKWPSISLTYSRATTQDYLEKHKIDSVSTSRAFNSSYSFDFLETSSSVNYTYSNPDSTDHISEARSESKDHNATASFSRAFWDKKIQSSVNVGFNKTDTKFESLGTPQTFDSPTVVPPVGALHGLYDIDDTPLTGMLSTNDNLRDGSANIDLNGFNRNMGLQFSSAERIQTIYLYVTTNAASLSPADYDWAVYSSVDGNQWAATAAPVIAYDGTHKWFKFDYPSEIEVRNIKVVNQKFPTVAASATRMIAIRKITQTPTNVYKTSAGRQFAGLSLSSTPIDRLNLHYSLNYDHGTQDTYDTDTDSMGHSAGLGYIVIPQYLTLNTNYSTTSTSTSQTPFSQSKVTTETTTDAYSLSFSSTPLPAVNANVNFSYNEYMTGGQTYSESGSVSANVFMNLYKGVDMSVGNSFTQSDNVQSKTSSETASYYSNINMTPWKSTNISVNGSFSNSANKDDKGHETSTTGKSLSSSVSFSPTRKIYLSGSFTIEPSTSQSYSATWLPTQNIQLGVRYGISGDSTNKGGDLSWTPFQRLSLHIGYSGTQTGNASNDHSETIFASASLRL